MKYCGVYERGRRYLVGNSRHTAWRFTVHHQPNHPVLVLEHAKFTVDVILSAIEMPGSMNRFQLSQWVRSHHPEVEVMVIDASVAAPIDVRADPLQMMMNAKDLPTERFQDFPLYQHSPRTAQDRTDGAKHGPW